MGIASLVLGILAFVCAAGGFLVSFAPGFGAIPGALLTLSAPLFALMGIVLGGVGLSRAREEGTESGLPTAGLVVSVIAFFPAFFVAITCGLCDMMCASSMIQNQGRRSNQSGPNVAPYYLQDAGLGGSPGLGPPPPPPMPFDPPPAVPPGPADPTPAADPTAPAAPAPDPAIGDFPPPPDQRP